MAAAARLRRRGVRGGAGLGRCGTFAGAVYSRDDVEVRGAGGKTGLDVRTRGIGNLCPAGFSHAGGGGVIDVVRGCALWLATREW